MIHRATCQEGCEAPGEWLYACWPVLHQKLDLTQLVMGEGDCNGDGVKLQAKPHHSLSWWRGFVLHLPKAQLG